MLGPTTLHCDTKTHPHVPGRNRHPEEELSPKSYGRVHMEDLKWMLSLLENSWLLSVLMQTLQPLCKAGDWDSGPPLDIHQPLQLESLSLLKVI